MGKRTLTPEQYARKLELNKRYKEKLKTDPVRMEAYREKNRVNHRKYYHKDLDKYKLKAKLKRLRWTEEQREAQRVCNRRHKEKIASCPVLKEQYAEYKRQWDKANKKRRVTKPSEPLLGSVLAASAPSHWRDILSSLNDAMPRCNDRDDMISQAALLMIEGADLDAAVNEARRIINKQSAPYLKTVRIEEVYSIY